MQTPESQEWTTLNPRPAWVQIVATIATIAAILNSVTGCAPRARPPSDLQVQAYVGGGIIGPKTLLVIGPSLTGHYERRYSFVVSDSASFQVSSDDMKRLWSEIERSHFVSLKSRYGRRVACDSEEMLSVVVHADQRRYGVTASNVGYPELQKLLSVINTAVPTGRRMQYHPQPLWWWPWLQKKVFGTRPC
ncbi:MAG TPA: hypothetical protein VL123_00475 [Candidatus Udaeobacter sp.]|jgi:hypothetical protein|nr:hypothetical protein [Candidatus Udaeobacter sp.]